MLLFRTLRHLKPVQIFDRIRRNLLRPKVSFEPIETMRKRCSDNFIAPVAKKNAELSGTKLKVLNKEMDIAEIGWDNKSLPKLWLYNQHYFDFLNNDSNQEKSSVKAELIENWILENPVGQGVGWEAYPTSLRIVNWVKWALDGNLMPQLFLSSLAVQTRWLAKRLELHLLGNHYFANAKALLFAGAFFDGKEANNWKSMGLKIIQKELQEQFLPDGAHFELSPTYHAAMTEDLLDLINLSQLYDLEFGEELAETSEKALSWLTNMTRPDLVPPLFNDAAYGVAPTLSNLIDYCQRLGLKVPVVPSAGMTDMPESGFFLYKSNKFNFWGDVGKLGPDYIPAHGHCDMLSFELFANGSPFIVDTGTSTYDECDRRMHERSTAAHNTVQVGGLEQSEIWGSFRVGRRATIVLREVSKTKVVGQHKGFGRHSPIHQRVFKFADNQITLSDSLISHRKSKKGHGRIHLHPNVIIEYSGNDHIATNLGDLYFDGISGFSLIDYHYAPEFNRLTSGRCIQLAFIDKMVTRIVI